jgi:hypothetical protein
MGASTPETGAKMLFHGRRMVKEGRDVKIANTKTIQLNGLRCFLIAMMKNATTVSRWRQGFFITWKRILDRAPQY